MKKFMALSMAAIMALTVAGRLQARRDHSRRHNSSRDCGKRGYHGS